MAFPIAAVIAVGQAIAQQAINAKQQRSAEEREYERNKGMTDTAYQRELALMKYQNDYNSPANQMARFKAAGLNPNLIYGQGTPGNMQSTPRVPQQAPHNARVVPIQLPDAMSLMADLRLKQAQADLLETKVDESGIKQELMSVQKRVAENNPYLAPGYLDSVVSNMKAVADMKKQEASFKLEEVTGTVTGPNGEQSFGTGMQRGYAIMLENWRQLQQRFDLANKDLAIRSQVLQSKEFQNELQKIQVEWMKQAEVTPQHVYQFIMMLLGSLLR